MREINFESLREQMVKRLVDKGIRDKKVLSSMAEVPRERFVPIELLALCYDDTALPLGQKYVIPHPWMIAFALQTLEIKEKDKVLEIGTNSGYQTAIISRLAGKVITLESSLDMAITAALRIKGIYRNVQIYVSPPLQGLEQFAPYDVIISNIPFLELPQSLVDQLKERGRLLFPLRTDICEYISLVKKNGGEITIEKLLKLDFIPLIKPSENTNQTVEENEKSSNKKKKDKDSSLHKGNNHREKSEEKEN